MCVLTEVKGAEEYIITSLENIKGMPEKKKKEMIEKGEAIKKKLKKYDK